MRTILLVFFIAASSQAATIYQVRSHLANGGTISSVLDASKDDLFRLRDIGEGPFIGAWDAALGTQPTELPDAETAKTAHDTAQAAVDAMPAQFANGVAVPDTNGTWMVLAPIADNEPVIAVPASASPMTPGEWKAIYDAKKAEYLAERQARQAAIDELGLTQAQVDAVRSYFDADVDALFPAMSVAQRNFMKVQRALTKAITKREIKEVR